MKKTKRLGTLKRKIRAGKPSTRTKIRNNKNSSGLQKARAAKKAIAAKLKTLKAEFKQKLQNVTETAYANATRDFQRDHIKKLEAKQKAIAAAEAKFEKKFAKKANKKTKSKHRKSTITMPAITTATQRAPTKRLGRRGRPRKIA